MPSLVIDEEYIPRYYSYNDYLEWEGKWELIGGIAYAMSPTPIIKHQEISYSIASQLHKKLKYVQEVYHDSKKKLYI